MEVDPMPPPLLTNSSQLRGRIAAVLQRPPPAGMKTWEVKRVVKELKEKFAEYRNPATLPEVKLAVGEAIQARDKTNGGKKQGAVTSVTTSMTFTANSSVITDANPQCDVNPSTASAQTISNQPTQLAFVSKRKQDEPSVLESNKRKRELEPALNSTLSDGGGELKLSRSEDSDSQTSTERKQHLPKENTLQKSLYASTRRKEHPTPASTPPPLSEQNPPLKQQTEQPSTTKSSSKSSKSSSKGIRPSTRYSDVGGLEPHVQELRELCEYPLTHPEIYRHLGVEPPSGVLLHGPPGCGKTLLANAIAGELGVAFFNVAAPEIVSGISGESEDKLRTLFLDAQANSPSIVFIDEIDAITSKRDSGAKGMELRIVAQLLTCMDQIAKSERGPVLVLGATNRPDALDPALRRAGRFDREIQLGIPDEAARERVLRVLVSKMRIVGDFDFASIAKRTPGFVGADLAALTKEAAVVAVNRIFSNLSASLISNSSSTSAFLDSTSTSASPPTNLINLTNRTTASDLLRSREEPLSEMELEPLWIEMKDFEVALPKVQPSAKREGFATVPAVSWEDVGALNGVREELTLAVSEPIKRPNKFRDMGLTVPAGVLLFGPPGCGKTLVAKAVANSSGANFISVKGPELLNKYVGESERAVRLVFTRARASAPCVVFFDELDALCPRRGGVAGGSGGSGGGSDTGVSERVVNQLLTEMDGLEARRDVFVMAATNRPELIDPAMLRPGRLDRLVYVPFPNAEDRLAILQTCARKTPMADDVDLRSVAFDTRLDGFSGADLTALVREAAVHALKRSGALDTDDDVEVRVEAQDFVHAASRVSPSVSLRDRNAYERMREKLASGRDLGA